MKFDTNIFTGTKDKKDNSQLIGMLHIPVSNILLGIGCTKYELPLMNKEDNGIWLKINKEFQKQNEIILIPEYKTEFPGVIAISKKLDSINELVKKLSFIDYIEERVVKEIELMYKYGITFFQLENVGAPYSTRNEIPIIEQCIMGYITSFIKSLYPDILLGIQILSFADNVALEIAVRYNLEYIRGESFLFPGIRPDTTNTITGTLKKDYLLRSYFNKELERENINKPLIFVDIQKKHTIFPERLNNIEEWLDNIRFLKIEGIILSGKYTGCSIDVEDFKKARAFVNKLKTCEEPINIPIIAGSGASKDNIGTYKEYCDAIIIGSFIKEKNNWENRIDESSLGQFMELYNS